MPLNNKKTKEELDQILNEPLEETPVELQEQDEEVEELQEPDVEEISEDEAESIEEQQDIEQPEDSLPDLEERYTESSREAQALFFKNQKLTNTMKQAVSTPEPTEQELKDYAKELGEDYEYLDTFQKGLLRDNLKNKRVSEKISEILKDTEEIEAWTKKVRHFVSREDILNRYPTLANNIDEFVKYATHSTRRGADLEDMIASFLYKYETVQRAKRKSLLLSSKGSPKPTPKKKGLNERDLIALRNSPDGQKKYKEAIKKGLIDL